MAKKLIRLLCLLLFCSYSLADNNFGSMFYVNGADASLGVLGQLFGTVGTVLSGNSVIVAKMFYYFNNGILIFTTVLLTYTMLTTIIDTANDGKALGNKFNYFTIIRSGVGLSALVPLVNGYCSVQLVIMWTILQGVGFANYIWSQAVVMINDNGGFSSSSMQTTYGSDEVTAGTIEALAMADPTGSYNSSNGAAVPVLILLRSALCTQAVYNYDVSAAAVNKAATPMADDYGYFIEDDGSVCFGTRFTDSGGNISYNCQCGHYQVPYSCTGTSGNTPSVSSSSTDNSTELYISNSTNIQSTLSTVMAYAKNLYIALEDVDPDILCPTYDNNSGTNINCNAATNVISMASLYAQYVQAYQLTQTAGKATDVCPDWVQNATTEGWMLAVSHYYDMTSNSGQTCNGVTLYNYVCMMPYSTASSDADDIIANSTKSPCMTQNSGYSSSDLCNTSYLDSAVWNNAGTLLNNTYTYENMISLLYNTTDSTINSNTHFASYYNDVLQKYLKVFIHTKFTPSRLSADLTTYGDQRPVVNGMIALINQVVGKVLGLDPYKATKPKDIFSSNVVSTKLPKPSAACRRCSSLTDCSGCLNTEGVGLLGAIYAETNPTDATQMDPVSSLRIVGKDALLYSVGYISFTIENVFNNLKNTAVNAAIMMDGISVAIAAVAAFIGAGTGMIGVFLFTAMNMFISITVAIHKALLMAWMPVAAAAAVVFLTIGIMLYIYIPFLPFVLFFSGVISWVIAVVEAMVAAPMIAMGITHPKGADFLGKAEQSAMLLLAVFIRPATIIIGFIAAISLSYVAMRLLNISFSVIFVQAFDAIGASSPGSMILGGTSIMIVYTYCCIAILSQTFSLIHQIPDKVMRWIGMPQDQTSSSAMEMVRGYKAGVSDMSGSAAGAASDSAKGSGVGDYKVQGSYTKVSSSASYTGSQGGVSDSSPQDDDPQLKTAGKGVVAAEESMTQTTAAVDADMTQQILENEAQETAAEEGAAAAAATQAKALGKDGNITDTESQT